MDSVCVVELHITVDCQNYGVLHNNALIENFVTSNNKMCWSAYKVPHPALEQKNIIFSKPLHI